MKHDCTIITYLIYIIYNKIYLIKKSVALYHALGEVCMVRYRSHKGHGSTFNLQENCSSLGVLKENFVGLVSEAITCARVVVRGYQGCRIYAARK